ncbi:ferrous iron transporter B [Pseudoxanthomonas helianthi]|uniref:Ferrous iron transporter B n=1 Tax=Pseudoxanthomonas helianthi TaxID=1453541 RepID=A0A940X5X7_9GAMM|nr:FimV/HubP family polar landmark protein [Pseudoxanthomonas helianthi]MBP3985791.1 ferrous iron transporter B [Pseudoxanthomonas helianthi]
MHERGAHLNRRRLLPTIRWLSAAALLLASGAALALGLGEIRVKSKPGQPLVAEIPVISSDPAEMEQLQARLASPETFDRVGLPRPQGLVEELDFAVAVSDEGQPVIRVTSASPVDQAAINFLIEVDWGQGRLVREYSALVNAPGVLATAPPPPIQAPQAAPSDAIVQAPEPPPTQPEPEPAPAPAARAPAMETGTGQVTVRAGQTLSQLARELVPSVGLNQAMQALLQANPDAFINGNINLLKQGAVLRAPDSPELAQVDAAQADDFVRRQMAEWRQARETARPASASAVAPPPSEARAAARPAPRVAEARLQIAPPVVQGGAQAGTTTGIQAGGEGEMLAEQQLQQTKEDLAARDAEVQELRSQVAELEKLKQQQEKLIQMKDSDLAAAQQKLAAQQGGNAGTPAWIWGGLALLIAGLVAAWLLGRRRVAAPAVVRNEPKPALDSAALAAAMPQAAPAAIEVEPEPEPEAVPRAEAASPAPAWHRDDASLNVTVPNAAPAGRERLELAIAYLDLGDVDTARDLLNEVAAGGDSAARQEAAQLLRELG